MKSQASKRNIKTFLKLNQLTETLFKVIEYKQAMKLMITFGSIIDPTQKRYRNFL